MTDPSPSRSPSSAHCAFVTGAAHGIGRATVLALLKEGWLVGAADIDTAGLERLATEAQSPRCLTYKLDVASIGDWQAALQSFHTVSQRLDLLINNAGILVSGDFESIDLARQLRLVDINIKGVMTGCYAAFPYLRQTPGATVINLSSASATYGQPSLATYSSTKFAVRGLTEALNIEWQRHGIRVIDMMPLFVQTDMVVGMDARSIERLGVHVRPDDVARHIVRAAQRARSHYPVHWHVGPLAGPLFALSGMVPGRLQRWIAKKIAA